MTTSTWTAHPDIAQSYRVRLAVLLPAIQLFYFILLWPLLYAQSGMTADLATGPIAPTESFVLNKVFFPLIAGLSLLLLISERHRLQRFHLAGLFLVCALLVYLLMTASWSLAPSVTISKLALLVMQGLGLLPAVLLARRIDSVLRPMFWLMALTLLANAVAVALLPPTPIGHAGIYAHKNTLGEIMVLTGFFALYGLGQGDRSLRLVGVLMVPVVLALLYMSQSKTSVGLFVLCPFLAAGVVCFRRYLRIAFPVLLGIGAIAGAFVLSGGLSGFSFHDLSVVITGDGTFTGRTELWGFALNAIAERPMTGFGYQAFWGIGAESPASIMVDTFIGKTPHAHNGYIDLMLQGGMVALILFCLLLLMVAFRIDREIDSKPATGFFLVSLFLYLVLQNLLETSWLQTLSATSLLTLLLVLAAAVHHQDGRGYP